jgi:hypothetical protein
MDIMVYPRDFLCVEDWSLSIDSCWVINSDHFMICSKPFGTAVKRNKSCNGRIWETMNKS